MKIIGMSFTELLALNPWDVKRLLDVEEIVYVAKVLNAFWAYDYTAAMAGRAGKHALLKSELHSDGFFISRIMLQHDNIRTIMAKQLVMRFRELRLTLPNWVSGIPDGATKLGKDVAALMGVKNAVMKKVGGSIKMGDEMAGSLAAGDSLLLVEDFCTRGTGFKETVVEITAKYPGVNIVPVELVLVNRGGLEEISVPEVGSFAILAAANRRINDWPADECPLCFKGSEAIKPKATDENWRDITTSQLPASEPVAG